MKSRNRFHISSTKIALHKNKYNNIHSSQCHFKNRSDSLAKFWRGTKYNPILINP